MKKLFFAAFAAFVMVSVSNVFANASMSGLNTALPQDTTTVDTVAPAEQPAEQPAQQSARNSRRNSGTGRGLNSKRNKR